MKVISVWRLDQPDVLFSRMICFDWYQYEIAHINENQLTYKGMMHRRRPANGFATLTDVIAPTVCVPRLMFRMTHAAREI